MAKRKQPNDATERAEKLPKMSAANRNVPKEIHSLADLSEEEEEEELSPSVDDEHSDEQSDESSGDENDISSLRPSKTKAALSAQDVQVARETSELFRSNIFKLQIDELIGELKLSDKLTQPLDRLLFQIKYLLKDSESLEDLSLAEAEELFSGKRDSITIPFADPKPKHGIKYKFGFKPPKDVNVVGSYSLKTAVRQPEGFGVDMLVTMPSPLFQSKDYLNYRYFHKRAFYLACIARKIKSDTSLPLDLHYTLFHDDPLRPFLRLDLKADWLPSKLKVHINIILGIDTGVFEGKKLARDRNCIRMQTDDVDALPATPWYNSSVLSETTHTPYLAFLHRTSLQCEAFKDACKLGRLWLRQRGFGTSPRKGGFGHFEWAMLMAVLLQGGGNSVGSKVLMNGYSSYQLFKATLSFLAAKDCFGLNFSPEVGRLTKLQPNTEKLPFILDRTCELNVLYKLTPWSYRLLKYEAGITHDLLGDMVQDRFEPVFLHNLNKPQLRYDTIISIEYFPESFSAREKISHQSYEQYFESRVYDVLDTGFGARSRAIAFIHNPLTSWPLSRRKGESSPSSVMLGVILNSDECEKLVTHGPPAESEQSEQFRQFWGKKSELRRFQDGSIKEAVVWNPKPTQLVVHEITSYLFSMHFPNCKLHMDHEKLLRHLPMPSGFSESVTSNALFQSKATSFSKAAYMMQELSDVPLRIRSVLPTSSSLRYTSIHQPIPFEVSGDDDCIAEGIIFFETSNRWPDDLNALEKTKTAFLLKIQEQISKTQNSYTATVGVDFNLIPGVIEIGFLQLQTPEGYIFKLRVSTDRDEQLYERTISQKESVDLYRQLYTGAAEHTQTIQIMALRYPFYSATVRLLKLWLRSQLLLGQIKSEVVELLALKPFVDSAPYGTPSSAITAFFRIIHFIANWDWRSTMLVLDVEKSSSISKDEPRSRQLSTVEGVTMNASLYQKMASSFTVLRQTDPALTHAPMFIGTKNDPTGSLWTKVIPRSDVGKLVGSRLTSLCRAVTALNTKEADKIFKPSLKDYDVVIHLANEGSKKPNVYKNLEVIGRFPELQSVVDESCNIPQSLCNDLQQKYRDAIIFFQGVDKHQRPVIAGIWQQDVQKSRKFKVNLGYSSMPTEDDMIIVNEKAIVKEISRIGGNLIENIDV